MRIWLFDIDGTLLRSGGAGKLAMAQALHTGFGRPADTGQVPFSGRTDRSIASDLFAYHQIEDVAEHWSQFVHHYLAALPQTLTQLDGGVLPGVLDVLRQLAELPGQRVGLLTGNIPAGAAAKLRHFQLESSFEFGFYGDQHLDRDDVARDAQRELARRLASPPDSLDIWVVGDTPSDVRCGKTIGARTIAVATGIHTTAQLAACRPDILVDDLSRLTISDLDRIG